MQVLANALPQNSLASKQRYHAKIRLVGIMLQIFIIFLFRISLKVTGYPLNNFVGAKILMTLKVALICLCVKWTCKHVQNSLRGICITVDYLSTGFLIKRK